MARLQKLMIFVSGYLAICTYSQLLPNTAPDKSEQGQAGTNQCGTGSNQTSECQNAFINSVDDFCLFAPPEPGPGSTIGETERFEVSWCMKSGTGTRLIPDGAITGAHFIQTPDYVQITGIGDLTLLNIPKGDEGGELDPHGADGNGNPIGGLVFSDAFGQLEQILEWTNFMSDSEFCFRACKPGPQAATLCNHIYDVMGCEWNMPGDYDAGFDSCKADTGEAMGVYGTSTFFQGQPNTPAAHPAPASSDCVTTSTIGNGFVVTTATPGASASAAATGSSSNSQVTPSSTASTPLPSLESSSSSSVPVALTSSESGNGTPSLTGAPSSPPTGSSAADTTSTSTSSPSSARGLREGVDKLFVTMGLTLMVGMVGALSLF